MTQTPKNFNNINNLFELHKNILISYILWKSSPKIYINKEKENS